MIPTISVIMPVYNAEKYLVESIESILNQSLKNFEFIIINDGSKDKSLGIIKKYAKKDKRIILLNNSRNLGLQKTLNKGLEVARGKYVARMDADDISLPKRLEIQFNYMEDHLEIFLVGSSAIVIDGNGNRLGIFKKFNNSSRIKKKLRKVNCIVHPSVMFRNNQIAYREKFKTSEDYDLYLRIISSGKKITNLSDPLLMYRITSGSFVSTMPNQSFYFNKAKEFYKQRLKEGRDEYNNLTPPRKINKISNKDLERNSTSTLIFIKLLDSSGKEIRREIKKYLKFNGIDLRIILYYLISFLPKRTVSFLQRI